MLVENKIQRSKKLVFIEISPAIPGVPIQRKINATVSKIRRVFRQSA